MFCSIGICCSGWSEAVCVVLLCAAVCCCVLLGGGNKNPLITVNYRYAAINHIARASGELKQHRHNKNYCTPTVQQSVTAGGMTYLAPYI